MKKKRDKGINGPVLPKQVDGHHTCPQSAQFVSFIRLISSLSSMSNWFPGQGTLPCVCTCVWGVWVPTTVRPQVTAGCWRSRQAGTDTGETVGLQVGTGGTGRSKPATGETVGPGGWLL